MQIPSRLPHKLLVSQKGRPEGFAAVKAIGVVGIVVVTHQVGPHQGVISAFPHSTHIITLSIRIIIVWMSNNPGFCNRDPVAG